MKQQIFEVFGIPFRSMPSLHSHHCNILSSSLSVRNIAIFANSYWNKVSFDCVYGQLLSNVGALFGKMDENQISGQSVPVNQIELIAIKILRVEKYLLSITSKATRKVPSIKVWLYQLNCWWTSTKNKANQRNRCATSKPTFDVCIVRTVNCAVTELVDRPLG